jgi:hypothetical protein
MEGGDTIPGADDGGRIDTELFLGKSYMPLSAAPPARAAQAS